MIKHIMSLKQYITIHKDGVDFAICAKRKPGYVDAYGKPRRNFAPPNYNGNTSILVQRKSQFLFAYFHHGPVAYSTNVWRISTIDDDFAEFIYRTLYNAFTKQRLELTEESIWQSLEDREYETIAQPDVYTIDDYKKLRASRYKITIPPTIDYEYDGGVYYIYFGRMRAEIRNNTSTYMVVYYTKHDYIVFNDIGVSTWNYTAKYWYVQSQNNIITEYLDQGWYSFARYANFYLILARKLQVICELQILPQPIYEEIFDQLPPEYIDAFKIE